MALPPKVYTLLCACFAAFGSFLFGYDLGVIAGVLVAQDFLNVTGNPDSDYTGFIVSSMLLGAFVATFPAALLADRFSRRSAIMVAALIFLLGGGLQAGAQNRHMMMAGRFFAGCGIGQMGLLAPLYQSEIAKPSHRGRLTTLVQFFLGIGALIASFVVYGCAKHHPGTAFQWRFPLALQCLPAVPLATLIFFLPESPRWLVAQGRHEDALKSLARLHAKGDIDDNFVRAQLADIQEGVTLEKQANIGWKTLFKDKQALRKIFLGIMLQFSVQMTGVSAIQYYAPQIFGSLGISADTTLLLQSLNSIVALIAQFFCVVFIDKLGRRPPLMVCNIISGCTFAVGAALQARFPNDGVNFNAKAGVAFVAMTWIFNAAFSFGVGPLSWTVPVEMFNTGMRAKGTALSTMASWLANFMIGQVTPRALASVGWKFYILFALCGFTNALTIWLILPETKGRTLEEMDAYFEETPFIVIFSKAKKVSKTEREEQLNQGLTTIGAPGEVSRYPAYQQEASSADGQDVGSKEKIGDGNVVNTLSR